MLSSLKGLGAPWRENKVAIHDLKQLFFSKLFEWTNALGVFTFDSLVDLLDCCNFHAL